MAAVLWAAATLVPAARAFAEDGDFRRGARVVILSLKKCCSSSAWAEVEAKVASELKAQGIRVEVVDGATAAESSRGNELAKALDDQDIVAALFVAKNGDGTASADLLFRDPRKKQAVLKRVGFSPVPGEEGVSIAALKIVELLTAGALDVASRPGVSPERTGETAERPAPGPVGPPEGPLRAGAEGRSAPGGSRALVLRLGAGAAVAPGNVTLLPAGFLAAGYAVSDALALEVEGSLSLPGKTIRHAGAKAGFFEGTARGYLLWDWWRPGPFYATAGGGAGVVFVNASGQSSGNRTGLTDVAGAAYAGVTSRARVALADAYWVGLCANVGLTFPRIVVQYAPGDELGFGWPLLEAAVTAGADVY